MPEPLLNHACNSPVSASLKLKILNGYLLRRIDDILANQFFSVAASQIFSQHFIVHSINLTQLKTATNSVIKVLVKKMSSFYSLAPFMDQVDKTLLHLQM